jgi:hypothetical protein
MIFFSRSCGTSRSNGALFATVPFPRIVDAGDVFCGKEFAGMD